MDIGGFGRIIVVLAVILLVVGFLIIVIGRFTGGRGLPGDIVLRRDGVTIYLPIMTSIIISIILTAILSLIVWLSNRGR